VTLEGIDGCGKTTQASRLVSALEVAGVDVLALREPGGTVISEKVRALLLDPANGEMCDECELLLYEAARAQLVRQVIEPALYAGRFVVCDRFYDSTTAYQAHARGLDADMVAGANTLGSCGLVPDRTVVLDLDPCTAFSRATSTSVDRLEGEGLAFQESVRAGFADVAARDPRRVVTIDATGDADVVFARLVQTLVDVLPQLSDLSVAQGVSHA
jgi:dTMP kinase